MRGKLVVFEGIDGCGKTTQAKMLCDFAKGMGFDCIFVREPGGTRIGERIRDVLLKEEMDPRTELFLFLSARSQLYSEVIIPALERGEIVISDRSPDSSLAYQGYGRGLDLEFVKKANEFATFGIKPDLMFYIDIDVDTALSRKDEKNRMEIDTEFLERVRKGYLEFVSRKGYMVIDGKRSPEDIGAEIRDAFLKLVGGERKRW